MKVKELKITSGSVSADNQPRTGVAPRRPPFKIGDVTDDFYVSSYEYMFLADVLTSLENCRAIADDPFLAKHFKEIERYLYKFVDPPHPYDGNLGDSVVVTFFE